MFRTLLRTFLPNPLDWVLKRTQKRGGKKILLGWNRGLGDIALGLFAILQRIQEIIPDAEVTFLIRENLQSGFSMLQGAKTLVAPSWKRGVPYDIKTTLYELGKDPKEFDLIIERPSPTDWVSWQRGRVIPRLKWDIKNDELCKKFDLEEGYTYIGVQPIAETDYGLWRNWPQKRWEELFSLLEKKEKVKVLLFGFDSQPNFSYRNVIDLRGKTTLFELLSIIKNRCSHVLLPDSGILSMIYYLDIDSSIEVFSFWADPYHGILKQAVPSPNPKLKHTPFIGAHRDLSTVEVGKVMKSLFPLKPLMQCPFAGEVKQGSLERTGAIILAGGQGSRLGIKGPKGTFPILGKPLFEWILEKTPKEGFPIAIMTSPSNHKETLLFFEERKNFGREIYFFQQEEESLLDEKKSPLSRKASNGNGSLFKSFAKSEVKEQFEKLGIDLVLIVPVENPLANPADLTLIGYHREKKAEVTLKCVKREYPNERMGALVEREGKVEILEYFHLDPKETYLYNNTGMMAMNLSFLLKMEKVDLPTYWIKKKIPDTGQYAFKKESFIFDALPFAQTVEALHFSRKSCYAPIKSLENLLEVETILKGIG